MSELIERAGAWMPIDVTTPPKWHTFIGRQVGSTTCGVAAAFCPTAWYFGLEFITGGSRGLAVCLGPLWIGVALLRTARTTLPAKGADHA
jgi:hypothetical protein